MQGNASFYYQKEPGICKKTYRDSDIVVRINAAWKVETRCGKAVCIRNLGGGGKYNFGTGQTIVAAIADVCGSCSINSLGILSSHFDSTTLWN